MTSYDFIMKMYITVHNQEEIFNPWCTSHNLLEWIRRKCNCEDDVILDLVDQDGQVKNLAGRLKDYACQLVSGRETYILIRVERQNDNGALHYTSLLNNLEDINPDLMLKLNSLSRPHTRSKNKFKGKTSSSKPQKLRPDPQPSPKRPASSEKKKPNK
ncbi:hypothetical protein ACJMK2_012202 [Sinanodonta woodiana]|uniref:Uncharacterized protein n=1 Tax=Sinanodonta woodiana TaxID=1069815 RepID=A0ABD3V7S1_SINWO